MFKYIDAISDYLFNSLKRHAIYFIIVMLIIFFTSAMVNNFVPAEGEEHKWMFLYAVNSLFKVILEIMMITISTIVISYTGIRIYKKIKHKEDDKNSNNTISPSQE